MVGLSGKKDESLMSFEGIELRLSSGAATPMAADEDTVKLDVLHSNCSGLSW